MKLIKSYIWKDGNDDSTLLGNHLSVPISQIPYFAGSQRLSFQSHNSSFEDQTFQQSERTYLRFESKGFMLPNPKNKSQDPKLSSDFMVIKEDICGVADGVGAWKQWDINPRGFAEELITNTCNIANNFLERYNNDDIAADLQDQLAEESLSKAFKLCQSPGSSTIIFYFIKRNTLHISYIGDSQLVVLRKDESLQKYKVIFQTQPIQISFNQPFQLAR